MIKNAFYSHRKLTTALFVMMAASSLLVTACGKKGPPRPPRRPQPPVVKDLDYTIHDDTVELSWTVPGRDAKAEAAIPAAVRVFRSRLSTAEADCENCPVRFTVAGDIPIRKRRSERSKPVRMSYGEFIETGYHYIYKVVVLDEYGIGGKHSNMVKFDHFSD